MIFFEEIYRMSERIFLLFVVLYTFIACSDADSSYDDLWKAYQVKNNKTFFAEEGKIRRSIFEQNAMLIAKHNLEADFGLWPYRMALNNFSDKTVEEIDVYRKCFRAKNISTGTTKVYTYKRNCGKNCKSSLPDAVDWRSKGFVTEVKNQGNCGSCWAFSSTGSLEGQIKAKTGRLVGLSEQNLIDCSFKQGNNGCNGGWMDYAFQYVYDNKGIDVESVYQYEAKVGECRFKRNGVGAFCSKYYRIKPGSEMDLQVAVASVGPISVTINVTDKFMHYRSGIFYDPTCSPEVIYHAVLVIGYGTYNGMDYWIVKNSWGTSWGLDGYILMARNMGNHCGIASHAVYPAV